MFYPVLRVCEDQVLTSDRYNRLTVSLMHWMLALYDPATGARPATDLHFSACKPSTLSVAGFHGREKDGSVAGNEGTEGPDPLSPVTEVQRLIFCALVAKSPFFSISHDVNGNDSHWRVACTRYLILNA